MPLFDLSPRATLPRRGAAAICLGVAGLAVAPRPVPPRQPPPKDPEAERLRAVLTQTLAELEALRALLP